MAERKRHSSTIAGGVGALLILFSLLLVCMGRNPLEDVPYHLVVAGSSLFIGLALLVWSRTDWIGIETVGLVIGALAALVTISAFAKQIERQDGRVKDANWAAENAAFGNPPRNSN